MHFVQEFNNNIVLLDSEAVEVFAYGRSELLLRLPPGLPPANHDRRVHADAAGSGQEQLVVGIDEGGRGGEVVFAAVSVKCVSVEGAPVKLQEGKS